MIFFLIILFVVFPQHAFGIHTLLYSNKVCLGQGSPISSFPDPQLCGNACIDYSGGPYTYFVYTASDGGCLCTKECSAQGNWNGRSVYSIGASTATRPPTATPSTAPTKTPTAVPSAIPTSPTASPTFSPTCTPSVVPTMKPTVTPSTFPSRSPTYIPTAVPSFTPTAAPTRVPTRLPSASPSVAPSATPTIVPTATPTAIPTYTPSCIPTANPSDTPTTVPTALPSHSPTFLPTVTPTFTPSAVPSAFPSSQPSSRPTGEPSTQPTNRPTTPTFSPTAIPTAVATSRTKASVTVNAGFTFTSVNGASLSSLSQETVKQSIANASHTTANNVELVSVTRADTNRRLFLRVEKFIVHTVAATLFKYNVVANIHFNLIDFPESFNASYVAEMKSKQIVRAVDTGVMNQIVHYYAIANSASQLLNATAANITVLSTTVTPAPSFSSSEASKLSAGQIAGLVVGIIIGAMLLIALVYWMIVVGRSRKDIRTVSQAFMNEPSIVLNESNVTQSAEEHPVVRKE
jgi:tetrahydromethanopterin S-methyltransferase subunit B